MQQEESCRIRNLSLFPLALRGTIGTMMELQKAYCEARRSLIRAKFKKLNERQIEAVLEKLVSAAEQQQDKLFGAEAMDVEAEIDVLETMMASDGLIEPRQGMK